MSLERLENEISADELDLWIEFMGIEPFGDEERMADQRNALSCYIKSNNPNKNIEDFMIYPPLRKDDGVEDWEAKLIKAMTTI